MTSRGRCAESGVTFATSFTCCWRGSLLIGNNQTNTSRKPPLLLGMTTIKARGCQGMLGYVYFELYTTMFMSVVPQTEYFHPASDFNKSILSSLQDREDVSYRKSFSYKRWSLFPCPAFVCVLRPWVQCVWKHKDWFQCSVTHHHWSSHPADRGLILSGHLWLTQSYWTPPASLAFTDLLSRDWTIWAESILSVSVMNCAMFFYWWPLKAKSSLLTASVTHAQILIIMIFFRLIQCKL